MEADNFLVERKCTKFCFCKILTCSRAPSNNLCTDIAKLAMCIATSYLTFLFAYNSCSLIAPDKFFTVRPIENAAVVGRINEKSVN